MDNIIAFIHSLLPVLHAFAAFAFLCKMLIVFTSKGFDMPYVFVSLFRIYNLADKKMAESKKRTYLMNFNNLLNYYLYFWGFITIFMAIVYKSL